MDAAPAPGTAAGQAAGERDARRLGLGLFLVSAAQFTLQLDFSIVNVALATIQREFGVSAVDLQWIVTGYALPFGALLLLGGRLGDLTGHRRLLVSGLLLFGVTSLLAGLAPDSVSVAALIYGLSQGQQRGFAAPATVVALVAAVVLAAAFVTAERRVPVPMVPVRVLAGPARRAALGTMFLVAAVVVGYVYFVTLYMQKALHFSALRAGLGLLPATLTVLVTSTWVARRLAARFGTRAVLAAGLVSIGLGQLSLTQLSASGSYAVNVLPGILLTSFGMGLLFPTIAVTVTAGVERGDRGLAGGLIAAAQQVGMAVGLAVLATVAAARSRAATGPVAAALVAGYRLSFWVAAGIVACALAVVLLLLRGNRTPRRITARSALAPGSTALRGAGRLAGGMRRRRPGRLPCREGSG